MYFLTKKKAVVVVVLVTLLAACGGEEEEQAVESCIGELGRFIGTPRLSVNNCMGTPSELKQQMLTVESDSYLRQCGWHDVDALGVGPSVLPGCRSEVSGSLHTKESAYRGFIILDVQCNVSKCRAVWELEFATSYDVNDPSFKR